jgi:hypothetical protein
MDFRSLPPVSCSAVERPGGCDQHSTDSDGQLETMGHPSSFGFFGSDIKIFVSSANLT